MGQSGRQLRPRARGLHWTIAPAERLPRVEAYDLTFPVLSDTETETIHAYGVVHPKGYPFNDVDIARPANFILDREGRVAWYHLPENWPRSLEAIRLPSLPSVVETYCS